MTVCLCTANPAEMDSDFGPRNYGPQPSDALEKVLEIMTEIESLSLVPDGTVPDCTSDPASMQISQTDTPGRLCGPA
jgi:hypothetical protein